MTHSILTFPVAVLALLCLVSELTGSLAIESGKNPGRQSGQSAAPAAAPQTPANNGAAPLIDPGSNVNINGPDKLLSYSVLIFGAVVLFLVVFVMARTKMPWNDASFKAMVLPLLLISGLFLITAGYSKDQITGMMGLLGSIAGYVLGRSENGRSSDQGIPANVPDEHPPAQAAEPQGRPAEGQQEGDG